MMPTITSKIALDTNIILYNHDEDSRKRSVAQKLLMLRPVISAQVVSEYLNVMKRKFPIAKADLVLLCVAWMRLCEFCPIGATTLENAHRIILRYDLQIFDSIIVAAVLEAGCDILYSEDMQHNMKIDGTLTIVNPFC
jgi:predicted nucleic acid-binding protein